jgi:hypothetical protein
MGFVNRKYSGSVYAYTELTGIGGHKPETTSDKREAISEYYRYELLRELASPEDGMSEGEVYEAFKKRHRLKKTPTTTYEAKQMLVEKFRGTNPVSIDIIYKNLVEIARKTMVGDALEDGDWNAPGTAYQHPI